MNEAESDQKLAALLGMDAPPGQSQDVTADPVEAPEPEQPAESVPDQPAGEVVSGTPPKEDPRLDRARTALLRSGFLAEELAGLDRDTLLARGEKRADALAAEQDTFRRLRDLESRLKDSEAAPSSEPTPKSELEDLRAKLKPLQEALADDGEATGPLADVIAGLSERLKTLETGVVQNRQQTEMSHISASRGRLGERFSELGDDRFFQDKVRPRMELLAKDGSFSDQSKTLEQRFDALLEASVRSLGVSPAVREEPPVANRKAETGTPLSPGRNTRSAPPSEAQRARMVFDMIEAGKTADEIRQAVG